MQPAPPPAWKYVEVRREPGGTVVRFSFRSIYDPFEVEAVKKELEAVVRDSQARVYVLDMGGVEFISSGFLGLLVTMTQTLRRAGAEVRVAALNAGIARVIKTTQLYRILDVRPSVD